MSVFTDAEIQYLNEGPLQGLLGRLATVGHDGRPHVMPLGVLYDPEADAIVIGGAAGTNMAASALIPASRGTPRGFASDRGGSWLGASTPAHFELTARDVS